MPEITKTMENEAYNTARAIFGDTIEELRQSVATNQIFTNEAIEELAMKFYYCDAFTMLTSDQITAMAQTLISE